MCTKFQHVSISMGLHLLLLFVIVHLLKSIPIKMFEKKNVGFLGLKKKAAKISDHPHNERNKWKNHHYDQNVINA